MSQNLWKCVELLFCKHIFSWHMGCASSGGAGGGAERRARGNEGDGGGARRRQSAKREDPEHSKKNRKTGGPYLFPSLYSEGNKSGSSRRRVPSGQWSWAQTPPKHLRGPDGGGGRGRWGAKPTKILRADPRPSFLHPPTTPFVTGPYLIVL